MLLASPDGRHQTAPAGRAARGREHLWAPTTPGTDSSSPYLHAARSIQQEAALAEAPAAEKIQRPIVPFLKIPADPTEKPYLMGSRCTKCGATYLGDRMACSKCFSAEPMDDVKLSDKGELHVFSIVHQSAPGVPTPYIAAIVDLPEGVSVRCNINGVEPDPKNLKFGMPVQMVTEKIRTDREGNDVIAFSFRPA
jgi:uncharacterized OB-fold protein